MIVMLYQDKNGIQKWVKRKTRDEIDAFQWCNNKEIDFNKPIEIYDLSDVEAARDKFLDNSMKFVNELLEKLLEKYKEDEICIDYDKLVSLYPSVCYDIQNKTIDYFKTISKEDEYLDEKNELIDRIAGIFDWDLNERYFVMLYNWTDDYCGDWMINIQEVLDCDFLDVRKPRENFDKFKFSPHNFER